MRFPFSIAVPAVRSWFAGLNSGVREGEFCLFCDLPMICFAAVAYLGKSCLRHKYQRAVQSFLDADSDEPCHCPHCSHMRNRRQAA